MSKKPRLQIGDKRGRWTVIDIIVSKKPSKHIPPRLYITTKLLCKCECGEERLISQKDLKPNRTLGCIKCYNNSKAEDLIGHKFGKYIVESKFGPTEYGLAWNCRCECGKPVVSTAVKLRKRGNKGCGKCFTAGDITAIHYHHISGGAVCRNIKFDISPLEMWELFLEQNKKCALTGVPLTLWKNESDYGTASLDRIDSNDGYTKQNCQWVHKTLNLCKHVLNNNEFLSMYTDIVKYSKEFDYCDWSITPLYKYKYKQTSDERSEEL